MPRSLHNLQIFFPGTATRAILYDSQFEVAIWLESLEFFWNLPTPTGVNAFNTSVTISVSLRFPYKNSLALVRERTIPIERSPLVGEVSVNFCGKEGCRVISTADPHGRSPCFLDRSFSPYLYFREMGWRMALRSALHSDRPVPAGRFLVLISVRGWVDTKTGSNRFITKIQWPHRESNLWPFGL
jgi:hypothetical protein